MSSCLICDRIEQIQAGNNPALICKFPHSYFVVGDHQFFSGYCLLLYKEHVRELHELTPDLQDELNRELMQATMAIVKTFQPWKINHCCLGNADEHIHWHIMPRYQDDPDCRNHPWLHSTEFQKHTIDESEKIALAKLIRDNV